jgi:hypothetical protein
VVTNHAGRQIDGAIGSLEILPEIVNPVGDNQFWVSTTDERYLFDHLSLYTEMTILFD